MKFWVQAAVEISVTAHYFKFKPSIIFKYLYLKEVHSVVPETIHTSTKVCMPHPLPHGISSSLHTFPIKIGLLRAPTPQNFQSPSLMWVWILSGPANNANLAEVVVGTQEQNLLQ